MAFIFMKTLPDEIRVSSVTGIRLEHPTQHWHQECLDCLHGDATHIQREWDAGLVILLSQFLKD